MDDSKRTQQTAFWQSMMNKYEERNYQLEEQQCQLQHRLEAMQCSMPVALMSKMNSNGNEIDMNKFMSQLGKPQITVTSATSIFSSCPCSPCMARENGVKSTPVKHKPSVVSGSKSSSCYCSNVNEEAHQPSISSGGSCSCSTQPSVGSGASGSSGSSCPCGSLNSQKSDSTGGSGSTGSSGSSGSCVCMAAFKPKATPNRTPSTTPRITPTTTPTVSLCTCSPCLAPQTGVNLESNMDNISIFSLQSADLNYMGKLQELANREKQMKHQIQEMEHREQAYMDTLKQADEMWSCMEGNYKKRLSNVQQSGDNSRIKFEQITERLMEENVRLGDDLKDLRLEMKHCMEKVQGPLCRQLEQEKRKSQQLECELQCSAQNVAEKEGAYMKQMGNLQNQLNCTCRNLGDLNSTNDELKRELCMLKCKYNEMQKDLINQKISEAHTLQMLQERMAADALREEDDSLYAIARKLSRTLTAVEGCCECNRLPADLTDTVKGIKTLVDMVDQAGKPKVKPPVKKEEPPEPSSDHEPSEEGAPGVIIESTIDVSIEGEGSVDVETETEVIIEKTCSGTTSRTASERLSREPSGQLSKHSSKRSSREPSKLSIAESERETEMQPGEGSGSEIEKDPSRTKSSRVSIKEPSGEQLGSKQPSKASSAASSKTSSKRSSKELALMSGEEELVRAGEEEAEGGEQHEIEIITEVEAAGDVEVEVETEVNLYEDVTDGVNITTTITGSGTLEVITEGPAGIIETTMTFTDSGNIEVTTEITEYGEGEAPLGSVRESPSLEESYRKSNLSVNVSSTSRFISSPSGGLSERALEGASSEYSAAITEGESDVLSARGKESGGELSEGEGTEGRTRRRASAGELSEEGSEEGKKSRKREKGGSDGISEEGAEGAAGGAETAEGAEGFKGMGAEGETGSEVTTAEAAAERAAAEEAAAEKAGAAQAAAGESAEGKTAAEVVAAEVAAAEKAAAAEAVAAEAVAAGAAAAGATAAEAAAGEAALAEATAAATVAAAGGLAAREGKAAADGVAGELAAREEGVAGLAETAAGKAGELEITIEISGESKGAPITIEAQTETEEVGEPREIRHESISEQPYDVEGPDNEELRKGVEEALSKANKDVLDALEQANKNVTDAMAKANQDVESALALAVKETQSKANKQAATDDILSLHTISGSKSIASGAQQSGEVRSAAPSGPARPPEPPAPSATLAPPATLATLPPPATLAPPATPATSAPPAPPTPSVAPIYIQQPIDESQTCRGVCAGLEITQKSVTIKETEETVTFEDASADIAAEEVSLYEEPGAVEEAEGEAAGFAEEFEEASAVIEAGTPLTIAAAAASGGEIIIEQEIFAEAGDISIEQTVTVEIDGTAEERRSAAEGGASTTATTKGSRTESKATISTAGSKGSRTESKAALSAAGSGPSSSRSTRPRAGSKAELRGEGSGIAISPSRKAIEMGEKSSKAESRASSATKGSRTDVQSKIPAISSSKKLLLSVHESSEISQRGSARASRTSLGSRPTSTKESRAGSTKEPRTGRAKGSRPGSATTSRESLRLSRRGSQMAEEEKLKGSKGSLAKGSLKSIPKSDGLGGKSPSASKKSIPYGGESVSRIPVPVTGSLRLPKTACDCGKCNCVKCFPDVMRKREEEEKARGSKQGGDCTCMPDCGCAVCTQGVTGRKAKPKHPPDCDCLECLCNPCGSLPKKEHPPDCDCVICLCDPCGKEDSSQMPSMPCLEASRETSCPEVINIREPSLAEHPPNCNCVMCLCDPCGKKESSLIPSLVESLKATREASCREVIHSRGPSLTRHPPDCDCVICRCYPCGASEEEIKEAEKNRGPSTTVVHKFPPEVCTCATCLCLEKSPPPVEQEPLAPEIIAATHDPNCTCVDCLLVCGTDPKCKSNIEIEDIPKLDDDAIEIQIDMIEKESEQRQEELNELKEVLKQIQCACYEAEVRSKQGSVTDKAFFAKQRSSFENTMSGLQMALNSVQDKCKQKDRMIAAMVKELQMRADSKVFDEMLHQLATQGSSVIAVDFDRKEICNSLPRPLCDPKYGIPSNQLKEPLVCKPCHHPDYPNCPCAARDKPATPPKETPPTETPPEETPPCNHPDYPDCPCKSNSKVPTTIPTTPPGDAAPCNHPAYPNCPCKDKENSPCFGDEGDNEKSLIEVVEESEPVTEELTAIPEEPAPIEKEPVPEQPKCNHPNYPRCPCTASKKMSEPIETPPPLLPCPQPDGTCPCPKPIEIAQPKSILCPKSDGTCPCPLKSPDDRRRSSKVRMSKDQPSTSEESDARPSSDSRRSSSRSSSSRRSSKSSSRSDRKSSSSERKSSSSSDRRSSGSDGKHHHHKRSSKHSSKHLPKHSSSKHPSSKRSSSKDSVHNKCPHKKRESRDRRSLGSQDKSPRPSTTPAEPPSAEPPITLVQSPSASLISHSARLGRFSSTPVAPPPGACICDGINSLEQTALPSNTLQAPLGEKIDSSPMEVNEIRRISPDSLLVKWNAPSSKYVTGYEILVDGIIKSRVHSARRTSAVLHMLTLRETVNIAIYAITTAGRCEPPANAVFQI